MSADSAVVESLVLNSSRNAPPGPTPDGTSSQSAGTSTISGPACASTRNTGDIA